MAWTLSLNLMHKKILPNNPLLQYNDEGKCALTAENDQAMPDSNFMYCECT